MTLCEMEEHKKTVEQLMHRLNVSNEFTGKKGHLQMSVLNCQSDFIITRNPIDDINEEDIKDSSFICICGRVPKIYLECDKIRKVFKYTESLLCCGDERCIEILSRKLRITHEADETKKYLILLKRAIKCAQK